MCTIFSNAIEIKAFFGILDFRCKKSVNPGLKSLQIGTKKDYSIPLPHCIDLMIDWS